MKKFLTSWFLSGAILLLALVAVLEMQHNGTSVSIIDKALVSKVTAVVGDAKVVKPGGARLPVRKGDVVYEGDTIETAGAAAVSIMFADNSSFAIDENARVSIDRFAYNAAQHKGSSFFSVLQGAFVYTSGLIGKDDPGGVNIQTPVGAIGIRGTVVAGNIKPAGTASQITLIDGAVVITNAAGTVDLNRRLETASVSDNKIVPVDIGPMDPQVFAHTYGAFLSSLAAAAEATPAPALNGAMDDAQKKLQILREHASHMETEGAAGDGKEWTGEQQKEYQKSLMDITRRQKELEDQARRETEQESGNR